MEVTSIQMLNGAISNSRDLKQNNDNLVSPLNTSMIQELGFHWVSNDGSFNNQSAYQLQLAKIKEDLSDSFPKFSKTVNSPSNLEEINLPPTSYIKHEQQNLHGLSGKVLLKSFSSGCLSNGLQLSGGELYSNAQSYANNVGGIARSSAGNFSQIFPNTNISNMNPLSSTFSNSLGMNLEALDLLTPTKSCGSYSQLSQNNLELFKESLSCNLGHLQESSHRPSSRPNKISFITNGVAETKRPSNFFDVKESHVASKKPRSESRSSFPPFKVRKEKLGNRIAALQQMVAPFGKTDTASVLMEAIGYIKFLQNQIEGLSKEAKNEEPKRDLRSRGLCLLPLSCISYITNGVGGVWPPP